MTDQVCQICKRPILTMAFLNTGACCQRHLELLREHQRSLPRLGGEVLVRGTVDPKTW